MLSAIKEMAKCQVSFEEIWEMAGILYELPPDSRNFVGMVGAACSILPDDTVKASALVFRFQAFLRLGLDDERMKAWRLPKDEEGSIPFLEAIYRAIAVAPLVVSDEDVSFDSDTFFETVLRVAEQEGEA